MQFLDDFFCERFLCYFDYIVDGTEMIDGFNDIVNENAFTGINSIRFKD